MKLSIRKLFFTTTFILAALIAILSTHWLIKQKSEKPGTVVIINGTTSVGKTTLIKELMKSMSDRFKVLDLDSFMNSYIVEHPYEEQINTLTSEKEKKLFEEKYYRTLFDNFYVMIQREALSRKDILVDTVMFHEENESISKILDGIPTIRILVYCPLDVSVARVKERNKLGIEKEKRGEFQPIEQYMMIYTAQTKPSEQVLDTVTSKDIKQLFRAVIDRTTRELPDDQKVKTAEITKKLEDDYKKFVQQFKLDDQEQVAVVSQDPYDLMVDCRHTPSEQAQAIVTFLKSTDK